MGKCHCLCAMNHKYRPQVCTAVATTVLAFDRAYIEMCQECRVASLDQQREGARMAKELLEGEADVGCMIMTQRGWAADMLQRVADSTEHGAFPQEITAFDLGRALGRALTNSNESEHLMLLGAEVLRGIQHYKNVKRDMEAESG